MLTGVELLVSKLLSRRFAAGTAAGAAALAHGVFRFIHQTGHCELMCVGDWVDEVVSEVLIGAGREPSSLYGVYPSVELGPATSRLPASTDAI